MTNLFRNLFERYFKLYFVLVLLGFVLCILLTNIPRLLASEIVARADNPIRLKNHFEKAEMVASTPPSNPFRWQVSSPKHPMAGEGGFMELRGSKVSFVLHF
jgi:hypothetical protein